MLYGVIPLKDLASISQNRETEHGKYKDEYKDHVSEMQQIKENETRLEFVR